MATASAKADILLTISSDVADLRKTQEEFARTRSSALEFAKIGTAFAAANQAVSAALAGIRGALKATMTEGVQFNAQLEQAQLGVAAVLKQFDPEKYKTFNQAIQASTGVIAELKKQAVESPATFAQLLEGFQSTAGVMSAVNIPLSKQVELLVMASQAMTTMGIPMFQLRQELTALLMGNIDRNARLGQSLLITPDDIKKAKASGQLYEFLADKLAAFAQGAKLASNNIAVLQSNLEDAKTMAAADATQELTEAYRGLLKSLTALMKSDAFKQIAERASSTAALAVTGVRNASSFAAQNPSLATGMAAGLTGAVGTGILTKAIRSLVGALRNPTISLGKSLGPMLVVGLTATFVQTMISSYGASLDEEIKKEESRSKAFFENISAFRNAQNKSDLAEAEKQAKDHIAILRKQLDEWGKLPSISQNSAHGKRETARIAEDIILYERLLAQIKSRGEAIADQNKKLAEQNAKIDAINAARKKGREDAAADYDKNIKADREAQFNAMSPSQQLAVLQKKLAEASTAYANRPSAADYLPVNISPDDARKLMPEAQKAADSKQAELDVQILNTKKQIAKIEEQITREKKAQDKAAQDELQNALKKMLDRQEEAVQQHLDDLSAKRAAVESSQLMTTGEKRLANLELLKQERAELERFIATLIRERDAAGGDAEKQIVQKRLDDAYKMLRGNSRETSRTLADVPVQGLDKFRTQLRQIGENADGMFDVLDAGFNGLKSGFMDALTSARNFGDGVKKVLTSLGMGIANAIMQIISMKIALGIFSYGTSLFSAGGGGPTTGALVGGGYINNMEPGVMAAAGGGTFMTSGPTKLTVGDNPGGVELVHVVPLSGKGTTRVNGRSMAMAGGGTALIDNMRINRPPRLSLGAGGLNGKSDGAGSVMNFNYSFQTGVTRQEVAALIPTIQAQTISAWEDMKRRQKI